MSNPFDQVANLIAQAANTVSVLANETIEVPNSNINFNNTATINVAVYTNPSRVDRANVEFSVNTSSVVFVGPAGPQGNTGNTGPQGNTGATGNTAPPLPIVVMTSDTPNLGSTDTYFTPQFKILANTLEEGSTFRILLAGDNTGAVAANLNLRFGLNGNTSDPSIFSWHNFPVEGGPVGHLLLEFLLTTRSMGQNANFILTPIVPYAHFLDYPAVGKGFPSNVFQANTQQDNYIGFSFVHNNVEGPTNFNTCVIQQIK